MENKFYYADNSVKNYHDGSKNVVKIEWANGAQEYYKDGVLHRENGPALIHADGSKEYWINGLRCNESDGPCIIWSDGKDEYFDKTVIDPRIRNINL